MKKTFVAIVFLLLFPAAGRGGDGSLGVEEYSSVEELAVKLSSYFPKVQGEVKTVRGGAVTLSLGKKDGLLPGMMLTLWRDGRDIVHPVTNAVLGRAEEEVGTVEVTALDDATSTANIKKKLKEPQQGDRARITPRKINLAIVPLREDHPEIMRTLTERLNEFGRFNVLDTDKTSAFIRNTKAKDAALVRELGSAFGLDAVIASSIYPSEGKLMFTARIFYAEDTSQLDTVVAMLKISSKKETLGEVKPFFTPGKAEKLVSPELPFVAQYFAAGDFDGDGKLEYAFSDGDRLHMYRNEPSGWREVWTEIVSDKGGTTMEWHGQTAVPRSSSLKHINLDQADINGNGRPELFVTGMREGKVFSSVIEFQEGAFRRIAEIPGFLAVTSYPGRGTVLLGQEYDAVSFYSGQPREYVWSEGKYAAASEVRVPKGFGIYGWTFADLGERQPLLVALDGDDRLHVYAADTLLWKSAEQYSAVDNYVFKPVTGMEAVLTGQSGQNDKSRRVRLPGRVLALDVNGDGRDEIVVVKNITSTFIGGFSGAELQGMSWTGARMDPVFSVKDIPGPVLDFRGSRDDRQEKRINALVRTKGGLFAKDRQQMIGYSIQ